MSRAYCAGHDILTEVTAVVCGYVYGKPITDPSTFLLVRDPEPFDINPDRSSSRLWKCACDRRVKGPRESPAAVVWTDGIELVGEV